MYLVYIKHDYYSDNYNVHYYSAAKSIPLFQMRPQL